MGQQSILEHVHQLVEEERTLRENARGADVSQRLTQIEEELDQCWDLLRQRRAKHEFGDDPDEARVRDKDTVERYIG